MTSALAGQSVFAGLRRRRARLSALFSVAFHLGVYAFFLTRALQSFLGLPEFSGSVESGAPTGPLDAVEMVEIAPPQKPSDNRSGMTPEMARAKIRAGADSSSKTSRKEQLEQLDNLSGIAGNINDESIESIAKFLGKKKGEYEVRTYYKNELNRNANFAASKVTEAVYDEAKNEYEITLEDREKDRFIFTLDGKLADDVKLSGIKLKDATISSIERWKKESGYGMRGVIVTFRDPDNKEAVLYLEGKRYYPFQKELMRFMFAKRGFKDDGGTLHTDGFDFGSATLLPPEKGDFRKIDGELVARKITLDKNGERLIEILRGEAAEEYRRDTAALGNPVVRNIYDRTKFLFPKLLGDGNATPAEKKNAEEKDKP